MRSAYCLVYIFYRCTRLAESGVYSSYGNHMIIYKHVATTKFFSLKFHIWSSLYSIWTLHVLDIATGKCQIRMTTTYKMINDIRHVTLILKITETNVWLFRSDWFDFDVITGSGIPEAWWECHWILTRFQTLHHNKTEKSPLSSWNICQGEKHKILLDMMIVEMHTIWWSCLNMFTLL